MENNVDLALNFDPIAESEKLAGGKHWSEFTHEENMMALLLTRLSGQSKKKVLQDSDDTFWGISWGAFKDKLLKEGFKLGLAYDFKHNDGKETEEAIIYYNPTKGIIVFATSYGNKDRINGGAAYAEVKAYSDEMRQEVFCNISTGGHISDNVFTTSWDVREGMFRHIERLEQYAAFQPKWIDKKRFLWFVDYEEQKVDGYNHKKITQGKINLLPVEAKAIFAT